ncbi:MAG TPA: hypothetical protein GXZ45_11455 [Propionibacterium sp.]|nr:hypothetical protein [Propionibacterium sp.]
MGRRDVTPEGVLLAWGERSAADLLSELLGEEVVVRRQCPACGSDRHGRPGVRLGDGSRPGVSIAHAVGLTLVGAVPTGRLGVDLEASDAAPPPGFASIADWVRAEAHLKATGEGLRGDATSAPGGTRRGIVEVGTGLVAAWCWLP